MYVSHSVKTLDINDPTVSYIGHYWLNCYIMNIIVP